MKWERFDLSTTFRHDFSVLREVTERSHCDLEKTAASACQEPSSLLDVTSPHVLDDFTKPSVKVVRFLSHFSSYGHKMIVLVCVNMIMFINN